MVREKTPFDKLDGVLKLVERGRSGRETRRAGACCCATPAPNPKRACSSKAASQAVLEKWSKQICEAIKRQVGA